MADPASGPGLGEDLVVHKCGLERASEAAKAAAAERPEADGGRAAQREKEGWEAFGSLPLAATVQHKHMSKMEKEVAAWKAAAKKKEAQTKRG